MLKIPQDCADTPEGYAAYLTERHGEGAIDEVARQLVHMESDDDQEGFMFWLSVQRSVYEALM